MIVWERQQGSDCIFTLQGLRNIRIIRAMLMLLLAPKTARFRLMSRDLLCVNSFSGVPIFGCSLTQIWSNGNGKFKQRRTEWWPWSSQIPSIVFPANPRAGSATAGGRPPFAKQVAAYKCHLKPFVMTVYGFQELHCQLQPASIPFLVDNEIPLALESYCVQTVFNITDTSETQQYVMMSLTSAVP